MNFLSDLLHALFGFTLPERASQTAYLVDDLYNFVMLLNVVGFFGFVGVMTFFIIRYHRNNNEKSAYIPHNATAETLWTVIPTIIFVGIAVWGLWAYYKKNEIPSEAMKISVTGKQWMWEFTYKNAEGQQFSTTDIMYVPVGKPVVLDMTSVDVIHSFFVPSFRVKQDTVPGMRTSLVFTPTKVGDFRIYCTEFCGTSHSKMRGIVRVVPKERFNHWLNFEMKEANISDPVELGARLYDNKGCASCHSTDGTPIIGPSFKGLWGSAREFADGSSIAAANLDYIRESLLAPNAKVVKGFPARMNSFAGQLSEKEINYLVEFIKTLK